MGLESKVNGVVVTLVSLVCVAPTGLTIFLYATPPLTGGLSNFAPCGAGVFWYRYSCIALDGGVPTANYCKPSHKSLLAPNLQPLRRFAPTPGAARPPSAERKVVVFGAFYAA